MAEAYAFYCREGNGPFNHEFAWRLLKVELKWMGTSIGCSSKRTKISESGAYSSSSNSETPSSYECNPEKSLMERPIGQKAAKRKAKANSDANATEKPFTTVHEIIGKK
jgi:hypothetical protein